jgi:hypothetical protein
VRSIAPADGADGDAEPTSVLGKGAIVACPESEAGCKDGAASPSCAGFESLQPKGVMKAIAKSQKTAFRSFIFERGPSRRKSKALLSLA